MSRGRHFHHLSASSCSSLASITSEQRLHRSSSISKTSTAAVRHPRYVPSSLPHLIHTPPLISTTPSRSTHIEANQAPKPTTTRIYTSNLPAPRSACSVRAGCSNSCSARSTTGQKRRSRNHRSLAETAKGAGGRFCTARGALHVL
jgi:hypothetical protein